MGILDPKERVIDAIITEEGRSQLSVGEMDFSFATFTDLGTFYDGVEGGVALEASGRPMFEAYARSSDRIVPVSGDGGDILQFQSGDLKFFGTSILSGTSAELNNDDRRGMTRALEVYVSGAVDNFAQNYVIGELEEFSDVKSFELEGGNSNFLSPSPSHPDVRSFFFRGNSTPASDSREGGVGLDDLPGCRSWRGRKIRLRAWFCEDR